MAVKWLTTISQVLVLLGLLTLWSGWKGNASLMGAFPFHSSAVQVTGVATGAHALIGVPCLLIGLILMLISLVWTVFEIAHR